MSAKKSKIEIATDEEVKQYAGKPGDAPDKDAAPATTPEPVAADGDNDTSLQKQLEEAQDKLLRAKAETQNLLRRTAVEKSEAIRYANERFAKAILPVVDDFERTLKAGQESGGADAVMEGVRLVYEKLVKVLRDHEVTVIDALHQPFNPTFHSAVMRQPSPDHEAGTVIEEVQKGYCLRDRVIRPTQVIIAAPTADAGEQSDESESEDRN
jgi:molecular chaperone GrpE